MITIGLIVLNNFKNDSRVLKEATSLAGNGFLVEVIALWESGLQLNESINKFSVHRIKLLTKNWPKNKAFQAIKYIEFMVRCIYKARKYKILHCNDLEALPIGVFIKIIFNKNCKIIYDAHEYETEQENLKGLSKKIAKKLERWMIKYVDEFICVSSSIADSYVADYGIRRPYVIYNCPNYQEASKNNILREKFSIGSNNKIFLYQGALGKNKGIELVLEVFSKMTSEYVVIFMGNGPLVGEIKKMSEIYKNIYFHESVPPNEIITYSSSADYGICFYQNTSLNMDYCLPNKIFEYMMSEIPQITSNLYEVRNFITKNNIGVVANSNDENGFYDAIERILRIDNSQMINSCRNIKRRYSWEGQESLFLQTYKN